MKTKLSRLGRPRSHECRLVMLVVVLVLVVGPPATPWRSSDQLEPPVWASSSWAARRGSCPSSPPTRWATSLAGCEGGAVGDGKSDACEMAVLLGKRVKRDVFNEVSLLVRVGRWSAAASEAAKWAGTEVGGLGGSSAEEAAVYIWTNMPSIITLVLLCIIVQTAFLVNLLTNGSWCNKSWKAKGGRATSQQETSCWELLNATKGSTLTSPWMRQSWSTSIQQLQTHRIFHGSAASTAFAAFIQTCTALLVLS